MGDSGASASVSVAARVRRYDWPAIRTSLNADGWARLPALLNARECASMQALYPQAQLFRSTIDMARHNFGRGEYRYFAAPLPPLVAALRSALYEPLAVTAREWAARLRRDPEQFPRT